MEGKWEGKEKRPREIERVATRGEAAAANAAAVAAAAESEAKASQDVSVCSLAESMSRELHARARSYQIEIFERAVRENVIAYIPTGGGKTLVSVLLLHELIYHQTNAPQSSPSSSLRSRWDSSEEVVAARRKHRMVFFLVNTVPLVVQQANVIRGHTSLSVGEYFGEMTLDTGGTLGPPLASCRVVHWRGALLMCVRVRVMCGQTSACGTASLRRTTCW
jgi:hypothetical protein